ncbi:glycosyl hydrolase family protein [Puteibacter caeruleilacunae]|nr:glycosyl hydrolase family protein [Puteibacter caeruleilacunae]
MSIGLYIKNLLGKFPKAEDIEKERAQLLKDYKAYLEVAESDELKHFISLRDEVQSDAFQNKKKEIIGLQFKGTQECNSLKEFEKLKKNGKLKKYFTTLKSAELKRYETIDSSEELTNYKELKSFVESNEYKNSKKKTEAIRFKGSDEDKAERELKALSKNKKLKIYLAVQKQLAQHNYSKKFEQEDFKVYEQLINKANKSKEDKAEISRLKENSELTNAINFKRSNQYSIYLDVAKGSLPKRYDELKELIASTDFKERKAFLLDKKKFEKTEEYSKFVEYTKLKQDNNTIFHTKFAKSKAYRNYTSVKDSNELQRYEELETYTSSQEFIDFKAFREDKKRYEKSEEYKKEQEFNQLNKLEHIQCYFKYEGTTAFDSITQYNVLFEDDFESNKLEDEKWSTINYAVKDHLKFPFSQPHDMQAFRNGGNIQVADHRLKLITKKESCEGYKWTPQLGFVPATFGFSSDMMNTGGNFKFKYGVIEVKAKMSSLKGIISSIYLSSGAALPHVDIVRSGTKLEAGTFVSGDPVKKFSFPFPSFVDNKRVIYRLEWNQQGFTWKINGVTIAEQQCAIDKELFLNVSSSVISNGILGSGPHTLEIDWIRCVAKK